MSSRATVADSYVVHRTCHRKGYLVRAPYAKSGTAVARYVAICYACPRQCPVLKAYMAVPARA
eukprot:1527736-Rhodomonas_salina.2